MRPFKTILRKRIWILLEKASYKTKQKRNHWINWEKTLPETLKEVLPILISSQQTAYVKNKPINKIGRLIPDITETVKFKYLGF